MVVVIEECGGDLQWEDVQRVMREVSPPRVAFEP